MSNTAPNDEELTPAGLRRNRLTLCYREGQKAGQDFQRLLHDNDPEQSSQDWADLLKLMQLPPLGMDGEGRDAWRSGFANGRHAGPDGELSPSPYMETKGASR